jgi:DNA-binding MarR family transcriptional regulator
MVSSITSTAPNVATAPAATKPAVKPAAAKVAKATKPAVKPKAAASKPAAAKVAKPATLGPLTPKQTLLLRHIGKAGKVGTTYNQLRRLINPSNPSSVKGLSLAMCANTVGGGVHLKSLQARGLIKTVPVTVPRSSYQWAATAAGTKALAKLGSLAK